MRPSRASVSSIRGRNPSAGTIRDRAAAAREPDRGRGPTASGLIGFLKALLFLPAGSRQMAHPDRHVRDSARRMARPIHHSRLEWLTAPFRHGPDAQTRTARERRWPLFEPRRREVFGVLVLVVAAAGISLSAPIVSPSSASRQMAVLPSGGGMLVDPTDTPIPTPGPTASGSENPTTTPSATDTPTPRPKPTPKPAPKAPTVRTFAALGDSLTAWPSSSPWPSRLDAADSRLRLVLNAGVPGNTTMQMRRRLSQVYAAHPQVMFLLGGTNDLGFGYSQASIIANLRAIILDAKAHKIWVLVLLVPPQSSTYAASRIDSLNAAIVAMARSLRVTYIDIHKPLTNSSGTFIGKYTSDGLHFSDLGAQVVANTIRARIRLLGL